MCYDLVRPSLTHWAHSSVTGQGNQQDGGQEPRPYQEVQIKYRLVTKENNSMGVQS